MLIKSIFLKKIQNHCIILQWKIFFIVDFIQYVHSTRLLEAVLFMYQIS